ncbi:MAG: metallophosphoesterase [Akkermansiaceae bacterium]
MKALALLLLGTTLLPAAPPSEFVRQPYIQLATDSSISIVWRTNKALKPVVKWGASPGQLTGIVPDSNLLTRAHPSAGGKNPLFKDAPANTRQFEATITGLKPQTTYYYGIFDGEKRITPANPSYRFKTHPVPGTENPVHFWVVGDSGTGSKDQAAVHTAMVNHVKKTGRPLDLYLHVGDMAYTHGTNQQFSDKFFNMYEPTLRHTVCWASMGNHEGHTSKGATGIGPFYDAYICPTKGEAGGLPSGKEAFYSFDFGKVHFICLDSHDLDRRPTGEMAQWLKADLEKTKAEFLVAFFHHPPYTKGSHDSDREHQLIEMREHIMPILESGGVDLVFTGHSHIYERSMLHDGAYATPTVAKGVIFDDGDGDPKGDGAYRKSAGLQPRNGTVSVVTGHGGTRNRRSGSHPLMKKIMVEHGSCLITIEGDTILGEMLNSKGQIRDTFAIKKSGTVTHTPIANPWQPAPYGRGAKKPTPKKTSVPAGSVELISKNAKWSYLAGSHPSGDDLTWTGPGFDASSWKSGKAGFGYGDNDDSTTLDMRNKFTTVYLRRVFGLPEKAKGKKFGLLISYDDAFIAYLNGKEVHRQGIDHGHGASAIEISDHEAGGKFEFIPLKIPDGLLQPGDLNVLAIEGHNVKKTSSDFTLHPALLMSK